MRVSQREFQRATMGARASRAFLVGLAGLTGVIVLAVFIGLQLRPSVTLAKRQAGLLDGIERRSPARIQRLAAEHYEDRWGFSGKDLAAAMVDAGGQFLALVVTPEDESVEIEGSRAVITVRLRLGGKPVGPVGQEVMRRINQLEHPFVFTWERQSFLPGSWRLVNVDQADLPDDLYGYEPGDFARALRGE